MPPYGLMCYGNAEYQRRPFVYAADGFEATCEYHVEAILPVGVAYQATRVDVAYVDGPEALQRIEHLPKGDMVLVQTVRNVWPGNPARPGLGPPQQRSGVIVLFGV